MTFDLQRHTAAIERDGYTVIEDFLSPSVLAEARRVLSLYLCAHAGRNGFEGLNTERVYTLVARPRRSIQGCEESHREPAHCSETQTAAFQRGT